MTEVRKRQQKWQALLGVCVYELLVLPFAALFGALCLNPELPGWAAGMFAALFIVCILSMAPALVVLYQRFKEIKGGELDAAAEY